MIAYVRGQLVEKTPSTAIIEAGGVGYELFIPLSTYDRLPRTGEDAKLLAYHCVREDDELLFGFWTAAERELFLKLTAVSGVGPKIALAMLSGLSVAELSLAIASGDVKRLSSVKGVGKKTAEKICVELKDRVNAIEAMGMSGRDGNLDVSYLHDAVLALAALGFDEATASKNVAAIASAHPEIHDAETVMRLALSGKI